MELNFEKPSEPTSEYQNKPEARKEPNRPRESDHEFMQDLKKKLKSSLSKLSDNDTREVGLKESKKLIERNSSNEALKIYISCLADLIKSKSPGAREQEVYLFGYLAEVYEERLIEESTPLRLLLKIAEGIQSYFKDLNRKVQEAAADSFCKLFKYSLPKTSQQLIFNFMFEPLNSILTSGIDVQAQQTAALAIFKWACVLIDIQDSVSLLTLFNKTFSLFLRLRSEFIDLISALGCMLQSCGFYPIMDSLSQFLNKINSYLKVPSSNSLIKIEACKLLIFIGKYLKDIQYSNMEKLPSDLIKSLKDLKSEKFPALQNIVREALKTWESYQNFLITFYDIPLVRTEEARAEYGVKEKWNHLRNLTTLIQHEQLAGKGEDVKWGVQNKGFLKKGSGKNLVGDTGNVDLMKALQKRPSVLEFVQKQPFVNLNKSVEILFKGDGKIKTYERPQNQMFEVQKGSNESLKNEKEELRGSNEFFWIKKKEELRGSNDKFWLKKKEDDQVIGAKNKEEIKNSNEVLWLKAKTKNQVELSQDKKEARPGCKAETPGNRKSEETKDFKIKNSETRDEKSRKYETRDEKPTKTESKYMSFSKTRGSRIKLFCDNQNLNPIPEVREKKSEKTLNPTPSKLDIKKAHFIEIKPPKRRKSEVIEINTSLDIDHQPVLAINPRKNFSLPSTPKNSSATQTNLNGPPSKSSQKDLVFSIIQANCNRLQKKLDSKFEYFNKNLDFINIRISEARVLISEKRAKIKISSRNQLISRFSRTSGVPISLARRSDLQADFLTSSWAEVLQLMKSGKINEGFSKCILMKDDIYLLRLMLHTEPCLRYLEPSIGKKAFQVLVRVLESRFVEVTGSKWLDEERRSSYLGQKNSERFGIEFKETEDLFN